MTLHFYGKPKPKAKHLYHVFILDEHEDAVYDFMFRSSKELTPLQEFDRAEAELQNILKHTPDVLEYIPEGYDTLVLKVEREHGFE